MPDCYRQHKPFSKNTSAACHNTVCKRLSWLHRPIFTQHSVTCKEIPLVSQNGMRPKEAHQTNHVASRWRVSEINFNRNPKLFLSLFPYETYQVSACCIYVRTNVSWVKWKISFPCTVAGFSLLSAFPLTFCLPAERFLF